MATDRLSLKLRAKTINPLRRDYRGRENEFTNEIVQLDKLDISRCHMVLAACPSPSTGTSMEIFYAWTLGKPVYSVVPNGVTVSPWLSYHSTRVCPTFDKAIKAIREAVKQ
jgi:nucleoside 2-deoxyribosyltransferase